MIHERNFKRRFNAIEIHWGCSYNGTGHLYYEVQRGESKGKMVKT